MDKGSQKGLFTMIGEGAVFEGMISAPHSIRIDGTVKGKIDTSESLTLGATGVVEADIKAKSAIIGGKVTGNILVEERVELESKSTLIGDIKTRNLVINEGCIFHGTSSMHKEKEVKV